MRKLLFGIVIGAAAMYLLDPEHGAERRARAAGGWREQKDTVLEAARSTASVVSGVGQEVGGRVSELRARADEAGNGRTGAAAGKAEPAGG
jgi:gas vesicle protein